MAITEEKGNELLTAVSSAIERNLEGAEIQIDANSAYYYEEDDVYAIYQFHRFIDDDHDTPEITLIRVEANWLVLQLTAYVTCEVNCSFILSVCDSIDKDCVPIGKSSMTREVYYKTELIISLSGDLSKPLNDLNVDEVEVPNTTINAYFGDVTPDWDYEE